jgi:hypothetical protein
VEVPVVVLDLAAPAVAPLGVVGLGGATFGLVTVWASAPAANTDNRMKTVSIDAQRNVQMYILMSTWSPLTEP